MKNKLAPPFKVAEFDIVYGKGVSQSGCVVDLAVEYGIVKKTGAWFSYNDEKIGQGKENTKDYLEKNPEVFEEIKNLIREKVASTGMEGEE